MLEIMNETIISNTSDDHFQAFEKKDVKEVQDFKLPKIERPTYRGGTIKQIKSTTKLPMLKNDSNGDISDTHEMAGSERRVKEVHSEDEENFAHQIQRKLKMIMEEQNIVDVEESYGTEDQDDFEQKINENKEIIKQHKLRKQNQLHQNNIMKPKNRKHHENKPSKKNKNESAYEKKIKDYKEGFMENKYLQKKKELFKKESIQNKPISLLKQVKSKQDLGNNAKISAISHQNKDFKKYPSQKMLTPLQKNQILFDAIHNYLQNPKRSDADIQIHQKSSKDKTQLQQKLKKFQQKLKNIKINQQQPLTSSNTGLNVRRISMVTTTQWRKVQVNDKGLISQQPSSFDKQVQRINRYLQKNQASLQRYIHNQKLLVDLQFMNKNRIGRQKLTSIDKIQA